MDYQKNYYQILGLNHTATQVEIKHAYRAMAKKYHPDLHNNSSLSRKQFEAVQEAYDLLSDITKKNQYDSVRRSFSLSPYAFSKDLSKSGWMDNKEQNHNTVIEEDVPLIPDRKKWLKPLILIIISLLIAYLIIHLPQK